jgi:hypothetical protein
MIRPKLYFERIAGKAEKGSSSIACDVRLTETGPPRTGCAARARRRSVDSRGTIPRTRGEIFVRAGQHRGTHKEACPCGFSRGRGGLDTRPVVAGIDF